MSSRDRVAQLFVFGSLLLGGYALWRGRHRSEVLSDSFDFDKSPSTRHMVPMHRRVDAEKIAEWLRSEEDAAKRLK